MQRINTGEQALPALFSFYAPPYGFSFHDNVDEAHFQLFYDSKYTATKCIRIAAQ
jgi:hypothetical protein